MTSSEIHCIDTNELEAALPWKKSALAAAVATAVAGGGPAMAQEDGQTADSDVDDSAIEEIVVTAMRQNLMDAQSLKRNADTVIETITAADLGSFPDKSVAEALQRVAGITVNRFAASSDTAHFSAEPSGVIVRGLNQVRTEFNGRDSFSANSSRGLSWGDVSPELMSGVDTYKNQMAELIEGGIAGTVNMRTRLPFDQDANTIALSGSYNYGDISDEWTPEMSGLYSTRWDLAGGGEMGVLINAAHSEVITRSEGLQLYRMNRIEGAGYPGAPDVVYFPAIVRGLDNIYDRERDGISAAFQFANADDTLQVTAQYNRSEYKNAWEEYVVDASPADLSFGESVFFNVTGQSAVGYDHNITIPVAAPGTPDFTFDSNGLFQTGVMATGLGGWWGGGAAEAAGFGANDVGDPVVYPCYGNGDNGWDVNNDPCLAATNQLKGINMSTATRSNNNENMTQDLSLNFKWAPSDDWRAAFDIQYVDSEVSNYDISAGFFSYAIADVDLTGGRPRLTMSDPSSLNNNMSPGGFANPNNYYIRWIMDHVEESEGDELALRADFEFDLDSNWMESVKVGTRYASREQDVRWSTYNWQNVANTWTGSPQFAYYNLDRHDPHDGGFTGYPENHYVVRDYDPNFYGGDAINPSTFVFANMSMMQDQAGYAAAMGAQSLGLNNYGTGWDPICSNVGARSDEIAGTCYTPSELSDVTEDTTALYVQLNFGNDAELFGVPVSGNIGVRYVETDIESAGGVSYPLLDSQNFFELVPDPANPGEFDINYLPRAYENLGCVSFDDYPLPPGFEPAVPSTIGCYITEDDYNFMDGADPTGSTKTSHEHWLPSFNIKFEFTDEWLLRFAASKALARPDIGNLRNYIGVSSTLPSQSDANDPLWITDGAGNITGADVYYSGGAQNPFLAPVEATQFDLSLEYYFADVGSFTVAAFQKEFDDYIQYGRYYRDMTNNGVTRTVEVRGPLNGEGAEINGYEVAFQRFFDFLPGPFDGLGVQANYTHINNKGITNQNISNVGGDGTNITGQAPDAVEVNKLEGLSDDSYTIIGMYEKYDISARVAYSWRSEYLVTAVDCCVAYPIWNEDYGQIDASIRWKMNDNWEFMLSGSNLNNEETVLRQQVTNADDGGLLLPNAWFQNDRRYTLSFRYKSD